eukprot:CAMPEP_0194522106 /NCGR_PEP_ID=MMETSP0253-20130528/56587_1 /TAXON_ID=2966 /ORGANISM="Noctiluca scintillans" /LENGTH=211 /DNA_ID=CAMNT_0039366513 /DNA_START=223 /DNA_END=858 /DNA_ORIENTATION=+
MDVFDAAYADVVWGGKDGNWVYTQTLLSWAVVAMVWSSETPVYYSLFGVFGAMTGSYVLYIPQKVSQRSVPVQYLVGAVVGFWCIWMLPKSTSEAEMSWWLWGLHCCLLAPKVTPVTLGVPRRVLLWALALLSFSLHMEALWEVWGSWRLPSTDCRISITIDAVGAACLTLLAIQCKSSMWSSCKWAFLMPLVSPGAVLAAFSALETPREN